MAKSTWKTVSIQIDERLSQAIDALKEELAMTSRADVFRTGVALLKIAMEAEKEGMRLAVISDGEVRRELVFPLVDPTQIYDAGWWMRSLIST